MRDRLTFGNPDGLLVVYVGRLGPEKVISVFGFDVGFWSTIMYIQLLIMYG